MVCSCDHICHSICAHRMCYIKKKSDRLYIESCAVVGRDLPEFVMLFREFLVAAYALPFVNEEIGDGACQLEYLVIQVQLVLLVS